MDALEILKSSSLFSTLDQSYLEHIAELTVMIKFEADELILQEGDEPDYCYLIVTGSVQLIRQYGKGKKWVLGELVAGTILGELSILDGLPRSASAIALEPTATLAILGSDFKKMLKTYPEIAVELLVIVAGRLRKEQSDLYIANSLLA